SSKNNSSQRSETRRASRPTAIREVSTATCKSSTRSGTCFAASSIWRRCSAKSSRRSLSSIARWVEVGMNSREKSPHISTRTALGTASHTRAPADTESSSDRALNDATPGADIRGSYVDLLRFTRRAGQTALINLKDSPMGGLDGTIALVTGGNG